MEYEHTEDTRFGISNKLRSYAEVGPFVKFVSSIFNVHCLRKVSLQTHVDSL